MAKINPNYSKLSAGYLFPEIAKRTKARAQSEDHSNGNNSSPPQVSSKTAHSSHGTLLITG